MSKKETEEVPLPPQPSLSLEKENQELKQRLQVEYEKQLLNSQGEMNYQILVAFNRLNEILINIGTVSNVLASELKEINTSLKWVAHESKKNSEKNF